MHPIKYAVLAKKTLLTSVGKVKAFSVSISKSVLYALPPPQKRGQVTPLTDQLCECIQENLLSIIRPPPKLVYFIHDPKSLSLLNQLHVGLSKPCFNKFKYKFGKTLNLLCTINGSVEDTQHYFLLCHAYGPGQTTRCFTRFFPQHLISKLRGC